MEQQQQQQQQQEQRSSNSSNIISTTTTTTTGNDTPTNTINNNIVPQLLNHQITYNELQIAVRVLNAIASLNNKKKNNNKKRKNNNDNNNNNNNNSNNHTNNPYNNCENGDDQKQNQQQQELEQEHDTNHDEGTEQEQEQGQENQDDDGLQLYQHSNLRCIRKALSQCIELHRRTMFNGLEEEIYYQQQRQNRTLQRQKQRQKISAQQQQFLSKTILRKGRIDKLLQLQNDAKQEEIQKVQQQYQQQLQQSSNNTDISLAAAAATKAITDYLIPDGHVETTTTIIITNHHHHHNSSRLLENGNDNSKKEIGNDDNDDDTMNMEVDTTTNTTTTNNDDNKQKEENLTMTTTNNNKHILLPKLRSCYVCKIRYRILHTFYDQLCPTCANTNWYKRHQTANLIGKIAIVTGSRVKIGYQTCLKLLRAGCTVIATTRFPNSACANYRKEPDFHTFCNRLQIYGLDLRDVTGIEAFTRYLKIHVPYCQTNGIDILINNACQTIRRPAGYYKSLIEQEQLLWSSGDTIHKSLLQGCYQFEHIRQQIQLDHNQHQHNNNNIIGNNSGSSSNNTNNQLEAGGLVNPQLMLEDTTLGEENNNYNVATANDNDDKKKIVSSLVTTEIESAAEAEPSSTNNTTRFERTGLTHSAAMAQMIVLPEDVGVNDTILPPGMTDVNGQQIDLRTTNSWLLKMEQVSTPEIMECMLINAIAPFVLNARLKPFMTIPDNDARPDRYIINVSAMEGKFYRFKKECHPHTNMAKAALNMLTRTSAEDLAKKHRIYMNSVDTGWINDENPLEKASKIAKNNMFQTPIDEIDAAARILDPIFTSVNGEGEKLYGKFLKDYKESEW